MKIDFKKTQTFIIWLLMLLVVIAIFATIATHWSQLNNVRMFDNPDVVGDTYVVHSLIYEHGSIANWRLTNAFFLFPDITLIYLISLFTATIYYIYPIYALIQCSLLIILTMALFRVLTKTSVGVRLGFLSVLGYFLWIIIAGPFSFSLYGCYDHLSTVLIPSFHYGSFVVEVACAAIFMKLLQKHSWTLLCLLSFLVTTHAPNKCFWKKCKKHLTGFSVRIFIFLGSIFKC